MDYWKEKKDYDEVNSTFSYCVYIIIYLLLIYMIIWAFTGMWPFLKNNYNSYALQAKAWIDGHLDLGRDYSYLEIASYNGKYFISFPPFPSYLLVPFTFLFGSNTPDHFIALISIVIGGIYSFKLARSLGRSNEEALFWTLFLIGGTNLVFISVNGWVWFLAQNLAFTLSICSIYYGINKKGGLSLLLWACSVGCRPFQIIYFPMLLYILWRGINNEQSIRFPKFIVKNKFWFIAPILIGMSYAILNYLRFGNIFEFGHNYLPEFIEAKNGQFNLQYLGENMKNLFRLPTIGADYKIIFPTFDGMAFWLVSPIFITYCMYFIYALIRKDSQHLIINIYLILLFILHLFLLASHKTLGGWHFGNRYTNDLLAYLFLGIMLLIPKKDVLKHLNYPFCIFGILFNLIGTIAVYNYWI